TSTQEIAEFITLPERKTMPKKIRENLNIYLQDLDREEPTDFILPPNVPGESWDEKLTYVFQGILNLNTQEKSNARILDAYYQVGSVLMEKG
ncbi:1056_t:CDS:1, partial [Paraglomus brasilianum]